MIKSGFAAFFMKIKTTSKNPKIDLVSELESVISVYLRSLTPGKIRKMSTSNFVQLLVLYSKLCPPGSPGTDQFWAMIESIRKKSI